VLYIDDNPVNTLLMAAMFERLPGLALQCECHPQQGVDRALAAPPALLLVDIQMPGLDGYEVLRLLRAAPATRTVPAIAVSANAMPQDVARGRAAGFADYLTKPLDLPRLRAAIQAVLPGWAPAPD
jgi:CheY-like chemotaxis protein